MSDLDDVKSKVVIVRYTGKSHHHLGVATFGVKLRVEDDGPPRLLWASTLLGFVRCCMSVCWCAGAPLTVSHSLLPSETGPDEHACG